MTNGERADRLFREVRQIAGEMRRALLDEAWNLATRRSQEALELAVKALLSEMSVDYPKTHDAVPVFARSIRARQIDVDAEILASLAALSQELAGIRSPAFYQEVTVTEAQARAWVRGVEEALHFAERLLASLRGTT